MSKKKAAWLGKGEKRGSNYIAPKKQSVIDRLMREKEKRQSIKAMEQARRLKRRK